MLAVWRMWRLEGWWSVPGHSFGRTEINTCKHQTCATDNPETGFMVGVEDLGKVREREKRRHGHTYPRVCHHHTYTAAAIVVDPTPPPPPCLAALPFNPNQLDTHIKHICTHIYTHIQRYAAVRRVRGDGNCFYRSFLFAYMDRLLREKVILW